MARRAGFAHNGGMDSILIHNKEMTPRDWAIDVAVALAAFAFGAVQLMVSASLILPDETLRRMLGIELGEDGSYTEPAIDPVWWTQDFSLSWRTM